jgi:hypothetical protein
MTSARLEKKLVAVEARRSEGFCQNSDFIVAEWFSFWYAYGKSHQIS